jgi:hypothetical protein
LYKIPRVLFSPFTKATSPANTKVDRLLAPLNERQQTKDITKQTPCTIMFSLNTLLNVPLHDDASSIIVVVDNARSPAHPVSSLKRTASPPTYTKRAKSNDITLMSRWSSIHQENSHKETRKRSGSLDDMLRSRSPAGVRGDQTSSTPPKIPVRRQISSSSPLNFQNMIAVSGPNASLRVPIRHQSPPKSKIASSWC